VQLAEQPRVDHRLGGEELRGETAFEAHAGLHACGGERFLHLHDFVPLDGQRLLDDDVFAVLRRLDELFGVLVGIAGDVHDVDIRTRQHGAQVLIGLDRRSMTRRQLLGR
jgi:hypothetical protein